MKRASVMLLVGLMMTVSVVAQNKVDEERMERDIEIAENVLSTMIKQAFDRKRSLFLFDVEGSYSSGYGVMFRVPNQAFGGLIYEPATVDVRGSVNRGLGYTFSFEETPEPPLEEEELERAMAKEEARAPKQKTEARTKRRITSDSAKREVDNKLIDAAKNFLADYGDMITQLTPEERIIITNRSNGQRIWVGSYASGLQQSYLSVETTKGEVNQLKQGKISREQFMAKLRVVNSEMEDELHPDRELLSSIFNRLYRSDLSKSYYTNESVYYEGLKDYGVIYYMKVYSSNQDAEDRYSMPTLKLEDIDREGRDKKVKELYPQFEKTLKEDMLEYGRTLKSLKGEESLIFNVTMTRCVGCGIPAFVEYGVKASVLSDYSSGKISRDVAFGKITSKKGPNQ